MRFIQKSISILTLLALLACNPAAGSGELKIEFEKYELANGLNVVLHKDKSDPIVSVAIQYHVGSNREVKGRTGFAHLFEHMLFQESENVAQDQFFKKIQNLGGTLNGGTNKDGTVYYEVVPKNALETVLWLESDRMGFLINTVTESAFANQQEVVQNEKRQRVDNRPYGHTWYVIDKNIFPDGHPYNWQVIGELEDLQSATVEDVREFYHNFYGPNNATLVIAGDFEDAEAKTLIEKYFGEIKRGKEVTPLKPLPVQLTETKKVYHEDNFARAAQFTMVWPTPEQFTKESYALDVLGDLLSDGKKSPLYQVLVKEKELTSSVASWNNGDELAGKFYVRITANSGKNLADVEKAIFEAFEKFEKDGIKDTDLKRVKASIETNFYNGISSVLGKSFNLAFYNEYAGDPGYISKDIAQTLAVTKEDVMNAYNKYIKGKHYVATSFVPKGQTDFIAKNSSPATVVEEEIKENVEQQVAESKSEEVQKTPTKFDRSVEPKTGPTPGLNIPQQWSETLANGMVTFGIEQNELPLVQFSVVLKGGQLLDYPDKVGVANLMTDIMMEGTKNKTPEQLEEEIALLGSSINMFTSNESITIRATSLRRNYDATLKLVEEILLEPRWDETEFARIKTKTLNNIKRREADPNSITSNVFNKLLYGEENILSQPTIGTKETVTAITIDDLKSYYNRNFSPTVTSFHIAGNVDKNIVMKSLATLDKNWEAKKVDFPEYVTQSAPDKSKVYFVDVPDAKQSVINIGYLTMPRTAEDYYPASVMNYKLGGSFSGNLNLILREEKGYTYGARSGFRSSTVQGAFIASSSVRSNATLESAIIFKEEMEKYRSGISEDDLEFTKNALIKSNTRRFETLNSLLGMLQTRSMYNLPADYVKQEENVVKSMTLEQHKELAQKYIKPDQMVYVVTGDKKTQMNRLKKLDFGNPIELDRYGNKPGDKKTKDNDKQIDLSKSKK